MKNKLCAVILFSVAALPFSALRAAEPTPASPADTGSAAIAPASSGLEAQLIALVDKVKVKLKAGAKTEAALAEEMKGFDALLAAHKNEQTDEVAQVLLMKALLYIQVFQDFDTGETLFKQLKADFPKTEAASRVDEVLLMIEKQKQSLKMQSALQPGAQFPDFSETSLTGQPLSIKGYKGKVVLVDFWATWCPPCVAELPNVLAAYQKYHDKGFEIVGISLDQSKEKLEKFLSEKGMTWAQYFDGKGWESELARSYGISGIPATFLLDREGKIVARDLRGGDLETELAKLLN